MTSMVPALAAFFPSSEHLKKLRAKCRKTGLVSLEIDEMRCLVSYDHGFRMVYLEDQSGISPLDLEGEWKDLRMVDAALHFYRAKARRK